MNLRMLALELLMKIQQEKAYSNIELSKQLANVPDERNRSLITTMVYGVIQYRRRLDYIIDCYVKKTKLQPDVRMILRLAVYQMEFMDKIPDHAVVNESVQLIRQRKKAWAAGFVNGVLRSMLRKEKKVSYPEKLYLGTYYSYPDWMCDEIQSQYGAQTEKILQQGNEPPTFALRVNTLQITREEFLQAYEKRGAAPGRLSRAGVVFPHGFSIKGDAGYQQGWYYPQDEASMMAAEILACEKDELVLDLCSAPGGKTTYLAQMMKNTGKIIAFDIYEHRLHLVQQTAQRLKLTNIETRLHDALVPIPELLHGADRVLLDAPCSGMGILRRKPEMKWTRQPEDMDSLCTLQAELLSRAIEYVKPGGYLVYSTCSIDKRENQWQFEAFLKGRDDICCEDLSAFFPHSQTAKHGYVQILPGEYGADGFFMAKVRRKG